MESILSHLALFGPTYLIFGNLLPTFLLKKNRHKQWLTQPKGHR